MEYTLIFINQNPNFDRALAEKRHQGGESEHNLLNLWEDEIDITGDPESMEILESDELTLKVEKDGRPAELKIPDCTVFRFHYKDGSTTELGASQSIVTEVEDRRLLKETIVYVYLMCDTEIFRPAAGIYLEKEPSGE